MATRRFSHRSLIAYALLIGAGVAGNYFGIPFFSGIDLLFGSIATLIIIRLFGTGWGVLAAFVISSYTYIVWGHSLPLITFVLEALVVGLLGDRWQRFSLLLLDGLFWFIVGMPLTWVSYTNMPQVDATGVTLIMLKQSVNGLFNAVVAGLALTFFPLSRWALGNDQRHRVSIRESTFNMLVAFLMIPALALTVMASRREVSMIDREVETLLSGESKHVIGDIGQWRERSVQAMAGLARVADRVGMAPSPVLTEHLNFLLVSSPDFRRITVMMPDGTVVASVAADSPTAGPEELANPAAVTEPVMRDGQVIGAAQGLLDTRYVSLQLMDAANPHPLHFTLLDRKGNVIATSRPDLEPLRPFDRSAGSELTWLDPGRYQRFPTGRMATVNRWRDSYEVLESAVPGSGDWVLVTEVSLAPYRSRLYQAYRDHLLIVLALILATQALSALLSGWVTRPLLQLTAITRYLPQRLRGGDSIDWPASPLVEVDALSADIRWMAAALQERFDEMEQEARQQRALLSAAMEAVDIPILITDEAERIVYANPPFLRDFGYTPDEVLGRRPIFLHGPLTDWAAVRRARDAVHYGQRIKVEMVNYRRDGTAMETELVLSPLRDREGKVTHHVGIMRDISARKTMEPTRSEQETCLASERAEQRVLPAAGVAAAPLGETVLVYASPTAAGPVSDALRAAGLKVDIVHTCDRAWDALSRGGYNALLLDPAVEGGGEAFVQDLRQSLRLADLPVVMIGSAPANDLIALGIGPQAALGGRRRRAEDGQVAGGDDRQGRAKDHVE